MIFLLFVLLVITLILAYYLNGQDYLAPGVLFAVSFSFSSLWAVFYAEEWGLGLHFNTFLVIFLGTLLFVATSLIVHGRAKKQRRIYRESENSDHIVYIEIENWKLWLFLLYELVVLLLTIRFYKGLGNSSAVEALYLYRQNKMNGVDNEVIMPAYLRLSSYVLIAAGYWFGLVLINHYYAKQTIDKKVLFIVILSIASTLIEGGRTYAISISLGIVSYAVLYRMKRSKLRNRLGMKRMLFLMFLAVMSLWGMVFFTKALGRKKLYTPIYYLAMYCGASIKNLDIYLNSRRIPPVVWGEQSFRGVYQFIQSRFHIYNSIYNGATPYQSYNGFALGNVYTTFEAYINDFNYWGFVILTIIMAWISQKTYEKALVSEQRKWPNFHFLLYGFLLPLILFSFFSNKFYEALVTIRFARYLIFWYLFTLFFCRIKIAFPRHRLSVKEHAAHRE